MTTPAREQTIRPPTYVEAHESLISKSLSGMRVGLPGVVTGYDATSQTCSVRPALTDADGQRMAVLGDVPVVFPQGAGFELTFPLASGDPVWLLFSERSLERWMTQGDYRPPQDPRRFDLSDAVAVPAPRPSRNPLALADANDLVLGLDNGNLLIRITAAGRIFIGNENTSVDVLDLLDQKLSALMTSTRNTAIGPQPLDVATMTTLGQIRSSLQSIKT